MNDENLSSTRTTTPLVPLDDVSLTSPALFKQLCLLVHATKYRNPRLQYFFFHSQAFEVEILPEIVKLILNKT